MSSNNIVVAVRVRPFNKGEIASKDQNVISMNGMETMINYNGKEHKFYFDYSFWSFDEYRISKNGYAEPNSEKYIDQKRLFDQLGIGVLENAWKGYNCTLFAYGQTGSGKTYSVMGYQENKGIIPLFCEELFNGINKKIPTLKDNEKFQVSMGILEIYNEKIRDLLNPKQTETLSIRQSPEKGFYVPSQLMVRVNSYSEILQKIQLANKHRTIAMTNMNETSSRAHTVVTIQFVQIQSNSKNVLTNKISLINLVDLAGSEKIKKSGAEGQRLFEAQNINKSLSHLGNCLRALSNKETHVPFRDSVLTKLLMNALGGNSKTVLLASISPSGWNYEETLSTLRFAERAKTVTTNAKINVSESNKIIKNLQEENLRLLDLIKELQSKSDKTITVEDSKRIEELQDQIDTNLKDVNEMKKSYKEQLEMAKAEIEKQKKEEEAEKQKLKDYPHFYNLNDDPSLNKVLVYIFDKSITKIGNSKATDKALTKEGVDIDINGINILPLHAEVIYDSQNNKLTIKPVSDSSIFINGDKVVSKEQELHHLDRILLGDSLYFFLYHPKIAGHDYTGEKEPNIDDARREVAGKSLEFQNMENERLIEELSKYLPLILEANTMARVMNKKIVYELIILKEKLPGYNDSNQSKVVVRALLTDKKQEFIIELDDFTYRRFAMVDLYNTFIGGEEISSTISQNDPFVPDDSIPLCIGFAEILLQPLIHYLNISQSIAVINFKGGIVGELDVQIDLCDEDWNIDEKTSGEMAINSNVFLKILLKSFTFKQAFFIGFKRVFCRFKFVDQIYQTKPSKLTNLTAIFNNEFNVEKRKINQSILNYMVNEMMGVEIWGHYGEDETNQILQPITMGEGETDKDKFINDLIELIKQRQTEGRRTIKISSIMKIAPPDSGATTKTSICCIQ